jgi:hypothetical protein
MDKNAEKCPFVPQMLLMTFWLRSALSFLPG